MRLGNHGRQACHHYPHLLPCLLSELARSTEDLGIVAGRGLVAGDKELGRDTGLTLGAGVDVLQNRPHARCAALELGTSNAVPLTLVRASGSLLECSSIGLRRLLGLLRLGLLSCGRSRLGHRLEGRRNLGGNSNEDTAGTIRL